ncbi:DUF7344 domain-containing protein [Natrinema salsiterrestre]|uniref:DUF7344 domain-containing protein n=1 Tax=Natrinema salsiterrestre TaxID=2950540 RepID=A0A9Q4Q420_9EURY|nr:hypothetical protein [Natrinema salsiterrestre]MDF9746793.1 hypothetical protein [Natrinema salsiterrestre]
MRQPHSTHLETDTVFAILSNPTDRSVVRYLCTVRETTVRELARQIATSERNDAPSEAGPTARPAVVTALHHNHLPRLDTHAVVSYDDSADNVTRGANFEEIEAFVEPLEARHVE